MTYEYHNLLYKSALSIRMFEQNLLRIFELGKVAGTTHTCIGQELLPCVLATCHRPGDIFIGNHRSHGHYLSLTSKYKELLLEITGSTNGLNQGYGGSQHILDEEYGYISNGVQGSFIATAVGISITLPQENVVVEYIGDGTFGEGIVYESLNLASLFNAPLLIVLEDNGIAQTTETSKTTAGSFKDRANAFNIEYQFTDSADPIELIKVSVFSINKVRRERRPLLLHVKSYRLGPHSKGDDSRGEDVLKLLRQNDPLTNLEKLLKEDTRIKIEFSTSELIGKIFQQFTDGNS
jgi:TPP-dependent pyruvate/acetoin dehydrogenase alpha subunit